VAAWVKVKWIQPLFDACNTLAPDRSHAQDGTIGDLAHASGTSGHNPDDTPGVQAERQDADSIPEVRAADVDSRGIPMERVVQAVLHGPASELNRLIYIIFNRRIWSKSNGWRQAVYTGDDPHDTHAHFSGDPAADEDSRPWTSVLALAEGTTVSDFDPYGKAPAAGNREAGVLTSDLWGQEMNGVSPYDSKTPSFRTKQLARIEEAVGRVAAPAIAQAAVNEAVRAALTDPDVVSALVKAINDDAARRAAE
jgi:hypothetical protein